MSKDKANEKINTSNGSNTTKKSPTSIIAILSVVIILGMACVIVFLANGANSQAQDHNVVITPENIEEVIAQAREDEANFVPLGSYEVSMNTEWIFPDGNSPSSNAYIENSVNNTNTVYFTIVLDKEPDKEIYRSPYLSVGSYIREVQFEDPLEAGFYSGVLTYHLVDDDFKEISTVSVAISISIQN